MPTRNDFKNISNTRFKEVKALYRNGLYDGAMYLSGYVIETALKARICKLLDSDYPETGSISRSYLTINLMI
jgi:HEPN domain-containing protein